MDAQRKKGILDVCVLAVLKKGPSYGYRIIRDISRCIDISESTLYPILKRLEQNGSLKTYRREYNGRIRKYYELTETGQNRINVFLDEWDELRTMYLFIEEENRKEPEVSFCSEDTGVQEDTAREEKDFGTKEKTEQEPEAEDKAGQQMVSQTEEAATEQPGEETEKSPADQMEKETQENPAENQPEEEAAVGRTEEETAEQPTA